MRITEAAESPIEAPPLARSVNPNCGAFPKGWAFKEKTASVAVRKKL